MNLHIRKTRREDIPDILKIFHSAREYMRKNNNFSQWDNEYPGLKDVENDILENSSFVGTGDNEEILMYFAFIKGEDPTYKTILNGSWLNDEYYGTIHRIASNGKSRGVLKAACDYCFQFVNNIRIDTHEDNKPMLKALSDLGFSRCGIIYCRDGSPRIAFQKINK